MDVVGRNQVRSGVPSSYFINFGNQGNVDSSDALLWIATPAGVSVVPELPYIEDVGASPNDPPVFVEGYAYTWFYTSSLGAGETRSAIARMTVTVPQAEIRAGIVPVEAFVAALGLQEASETTAVSRAAVAAALVSPSSIGLSDDPRPGDILYKLSDPSDSIPTGHIGIFVGEMTDGQGNALPCSPECVVDMVLSGADHTGRDGLRARSLRTWARTETEGGTLVAIRRPRDATDSQAAAAAQEASRRYLMGLPWPSFRVFPLSNQEDCVSWVWAVYETTGYQPRWTRWDSPAAVYEINTGSAWPFDRSIPTRVWRLMYNVTPEAAVSRVWRLLTGIPALIIRTAQAIDPNEKSGSHGAGLGQFVAIQQPLRYAIAFENVETATAPARDVVIVDQLDSTKVDVDTIALGPITFGGRQFAPPIGVTDFETVVDLRPASDMSVRVAVSLNRGTGLLRWTFTSLDPATGLPPADPLAGFLPPNFNPPEGDGAVSLTVSPRRDLATGTRVDNTASIVFDANAPIVTNTWSNTIDNDLPVSQVRPIVSPLTNAFSVTWAGNDVGSGIRDFSVFVSEDGGAYEPWLLNTTLTIATFVGRYEHRYSFYSIARDQAGNVEAAPATPDATVDVTNTPPRVTGSTVTVGASTTALSAALGTVADDQEVATALTVLATQASGTGVTLGALTISPAGLVQAAVSATCSATLSTFMLRATDDGGRFAEAPFTISIAPNPAPTLGNYAASSVVQGGSTTVVSSAPPADGGAVSSVVVSAPGFTGTLAVNATTGVVTVGNAGPAGVYTVTVRATDNCGATTTRTFSLAVLYTFSGYFQPVDNIPMVNAVRAGSAIPVKFSLGGSQGMAIFAAGSPASQPIACTSGAPTDEIEQTVTGGGSSLTYDPVAGQYIYIWNTDRAWKGTCRRLIVKFIDGSTRDALFQLR